ncbi:MAG: hypothetical protein ABW150_00670, partial [Candidatus Thiodiazotropha sp.]
MIHHFLLKTPVKHDSLPVCPPGCCLLPASRRTLPVIAPVMAALPAPDSLTRMFHPFLNLAGDMAKLGWFALTGNQTS